MSTAEQRPTTGKAPRPRRNPPGGTRTDARATPKRARPRTYGDDVKAQALEDLKRTRDLAGVHDFHGIPKSTLSGWARRAGIDLGEAARARTAAAREASEARVAEVRLTTVDRLERVLEEELETHAHRLQLERALSTELARALAGDLTDRTGDVFRLMRGESAATVMLRDPDSHLAQLVAALELLGVTVPKRDTVGAWTRAVHDLALLKGEATERGDLFVRFGIPRPDPRASDASAVPQDQLGR